MNKQEFLNALAAQLAQLPQKEIEKSLVYYAEMIDDRVEDGMSEEDAVAGLGSLNEISDSIQMELPLTTLIKSKMKPKRRWKAWNVVLLILGSPVWIPLLIAFCAVFVSVYVTVWSAIISLYAGVLSLVAGGLAGIVGSFFQYGSHPSSGFFLLGGGICCVGLGILSFFGVNKLSAWLIQFTRLFLRWIKGMFIRKEAE